MASIEGRLAARQVGIIMPAGVVLTAGNIPGGQSFILLSSADTVLEAPFFGLVTGFSSASAMNARGC